MVFTKIIRLFALNFYEPIVNMGFALVNYHVINFISFRLISLHWPDLTWPDLTWPDQAWHDLTWPGLTWPGLTWSDLIWSDVKLWKARFTLKYLSCKNFNSKQTPQFQNNLCDIYDWDLQLTYSLFPNYSSWHICSCHMRKLENTTLN